MNIIVRTVEKDNTAQGGSECKFYRTYELPAAGSGVQTLFQYGSMRNGKSGGQFKAGFDGPGQIRKKTNEGYYSLEQITITVPDAKVSQLRADTKALGQLLDNVVAASSVAPKGRSSSSSTSPTSTPAPVTAPRSADPTPQATPAAPPTLDRLIVLNAELLATITQAAVDPALAMAIFPRLVAEVADLEADVRKIRSYLETVELLVTEA